MEVKPLGVEVRILSEEYHLFLDLDHLELGWLPLQSKINPEMRGNGDGGGVRQQMRTRPPWSELWFVLVLVWIWWFLVSLLLVVLIYRTRNSWDSRPWLHLAR